MKYWDRNDLLGTQYKHVPGWSDNAWDIYMLYGRKLNGREICHPRQSFTCIRRPRRDPALDPAIFGSRVSQLLERH